jgi:aspartyl/asparaginyl beta-hydroxylase
MTTSDISATPTTRPTLPQGTRLNMSFDIERLVADVERLGRSTWMRQRSFADDGTITEAEVDWRCRPLRSVGGDPDRTDPGGPGLDDFADTPWLRSAPYLAEVLSSIPAQLRSARLLALGPGASSWEHNDTKYGPAWGTARLHVPITTSHGAILYLEGEPHHWEPGSLCFADFSRLHRVENTGSVTRVHLVVDTMVSEPLLHLFPHEYRRLLTPADVLVNRAPVALTPAEAAARFRVQCDLPSSFVDWEDEDGAFTADSSQFRATVETCGTRVVLLRDGRPILGLVHIGDGEFRFAGWTDERTLQIMHTPFSTSVTMRTRRGSGTWSATVPARSLPPTSPHTTTGHTD